MSARTLEQIYKLLEEPILEQAIYTREGGGGTLSYVPGDYVLDRANHIFGALNFDDRVTHIERVMLHEVEGKYGNLWEAVYEATVEVCIHIPGLAIECIKSGSACGSGRSKSIGDACHNAITESETDAYKRAVRKIGGSLGQQLYRKKGNLGELPSRLTPPENMGEVLALYVDRVNALETMETMQELVSVIRLESDLSHDERIELRVRLQMKYNEMKGSGDA